MISFIISNNFFKFSTILLSVIRHLVHSHSVPLFPQVEEDLEERCDPGLADLIEEIQNVLAKDPATIPRMTVNPSLRQERGRFDHLGYPIFNMAPPIKKLKYPKTINDRTQNEKIADMKTPEEMCQVPRFFKLRY